MSSPRRARRGWASGRRPGRRASIVAITVAVLAASCVDWGGTREIEFDDPYIDQLESHRPGGWRGMVGLYRAYAHVDRAFRFEEEGRLDTAIAELGQYLERHPEDIQVKAYHLDLLYRSDRWSEVVDEATEILEVEPRFVPALLARGRARGELGQPGAAIEDLLAASRAPTVRPSDRSAARSDAARFALVEAAGHEADERWGAATAAYEAALDLPLDDGQRRQAERGRARTAAARAMADRDFEAAVPELEAIVALDGVPMAERREALADLAVALEGLGRAGEAGARLEQLIAAGPGERGSTGELHVRAADQFLAAGQPIRAATHLEAAGRQTAGESRSRLMQRAAGLYREAGRIPEAVAALQAAVDAAPQDASVRAELGRMLVRAGRSAEAEALLHQALEESSDERGLSEAERTASRQAFAAAHEAAGRIDAAMALYRLIAEEQPAGSAARLDALQRLAELHARRGDDRDAADRMMALHREAAEPGDWALRAGDSYAAVGAWSDAAAAYRSALAVGSISKVDGARRLGVALFEAGAGREAEEALTAIPPRERTGQDLRYLAAVARESGDTTRAVDLYRQALDGAGTPGDSAAIQRSIGYLQLGTDDTAAVVALGRAVEHEPDAAVSLDLARALLRLDRPEAALAALDPDDLATAATSALVMERLDLLAEVQARRGDTVGALAALQDAAEREPTAHRLNRLAFFHELTGDYPRAAAAFERAYNARPTSFQAARVAYAYRRTGAEIRATDWFRRAIDAAAEEGADTSELDLDAIRREVAVLTDRLAIAAYASLRTGDGDGTALPPTGGVGRGGVASQGGAEVRVLPLVQRVSWGRELELVGRLFWGFEDGLRVDSDSYQGQLGVRYRPRAAPGAALGLERWVGLGAAARDGWATRLQYSRLLGRPYAEPGAAPAPYAAAYGDAAYLFDSGGTFTLYAEVRPGVVVPLGRRTALLPHGAVATYHQSPGGPGQSYIEGGPGLGFQLRMPREGAFALDYWSLELMAQYRWGTFPGFLDAGGGSYDGLVLTLVLNL